MRIEIQDKDFWIQQCSLAIKNIQEERQRKQKEWESSSWWHRFTTDEPIGVNGSLTRLPWNWSGEWEPKELKRLLELPNCGAVEINPYAIDLSYILSWAGRTKENTTDVQGTSGEQSEQETNENE